MKNLLILSLLFLWSCKESIKSPDSLQLPEVKEHSYVVTVRSNVTGESKTYNPPNSENFKITFEEQKGKVACGFKADVKNEEKIFEREFICAGVRNNRDEAIISFLVTCDYHSNNTFFKAIVPELGVNHTFDISCKFGK